MGSDESESIAVAGAAPVSDDQPNVVCIELRGHNTYGQLRGCSWRCGGKVEKEP